MAVRLFAATRFIALLLALLTISTFQIHGVAAQEANVTITPETSVNAKISPGNNKYSYYGCYEETTQLNNTNGMRALNSGISESLDTMTVEVCLKYCADGNYAFAGLEYTKECYCSPYISQLSTKLPDTSCNLACQGNTSQICGGALRLTVYEKSSSAKGTGAKVGHNAPVGSILALGIAMGVLLCLA